VIDGGHHRPHLAKRKTDAIEERANQHLYLLKDRAPQVVASTVVTTVVVVTNLIANIFVAAIFRATNQRALDASYILVDVVQIFVDALDVLLHLSLLALLCKAHKLCQISDMIRCCPANPQSLAVLHTFRIQIIFARMDISVDYPIPRKVLLVHFKPAKLFTVHGQRVCRRLCCRVLRAKRSCPIADRTADALIASIRRRCVQGIDHTAATDRVPAPRQD
jgi:hypothetical protein